MRPVLSVIVVSFNTCELTRLCLETLQRHTDVPYELLVWDNASTDGSAEWLAAYDGPHIKEISLSPENIGFAPAVNACIARRTPGTYVALVGSDLFVPPRWASQAMAHFDALPDVAAVAPLGWGLGGRQDYTAMFGPIDFDPWRRPLGSDFDEFAARVYQRQRGWCRTAKFLGFACAILHPKALEQIGALDRNLAFAAHDFDWSLRARLAGWNLIVAEDVVVCHESQASFRTLSAEAREEVRAMAWRHFREKWADLIDLYGWEDLLAGTDMPPLSHYRLIVRRI